jgi:hypothetical protein
MLRFCLFPLLVSSVFVQTPSPHAEQGSERPKKPFTISQVWTLNAIYRDPKRSVMFRYPSTWDEATQFGFERSALRELPTKPIAGFGYEEGGFPRDRIVGPYSSTNLEGFGVVYSAVQVTAADKCERMAASLSRVARRGTVAFGGRSFSDYEVGEAGMSQGFTGDLYATFADSTCYLFETDVAWAAAAISDNISALTTAQNDFINAHLLNIMRTVRIAPGR